MCFTAVTIMCAGTVAYADTADITEGSENTDNSVDSAVSSAVTSKAEETTENTDIPYSDVTEYLEKKGTVDGIDVYFKRDDIDDIIWAKNGGKPEKKSDYTDSPKMLDDKISDIKKLGEIVLADAEKKSVLAEMDKSGEGMYISGGGRYLLYTDNNLKPIRMDYVISTIDEPYLFRSTDGKTLELTDSEYSEILQKYSYSKTENGMRIYNSADKKAFAWLNEDGTQVLAVYRICANNGEYRLLVNDRYGNIAVENVKTGYIWHSSPIGATRDENATPLQIKQLLSSVSIKYAEPEKRSTSSVYSAAEGCKITVTDIDGGVRVNYSFKEGFTFPAEYVLEGDHVKASVKIADITESNDKRIITEITLLNNFGAAGSEEEGYFAVPDGCGAKISFNSKRTALSNSYSQQVYGSDVTAVPTNKGIQAEQIYLPVYGIIKQNNALLAVASRGDTNAVLSANVAGQSNTSYNTCSFNFMLRESDVFYMSGKSNDKFTVFESGEIKSDDIEMLYFPLTETSADFITVASRYRQYLTENGYIKANSADSPKMLVSFYGGTRRKKSVLGIPVTTTQTAVTFDDAYEILEKLSENGVENIAVTYHNMTDDGISRKVDTLANPSSQLGGKSGFSRLTDFINDKGYSLYPGSDSMEFYSGNGYNSLSDTCVRVSGAYSRIVSYDMAYGIPNGFKDDMSLLSPASFGKLFGDISENYSDSAVDGISIGQLSHSLYGDFGKKNISRYKAKKLLTEGLDSLDMNILAETANAYILPYTDFISDMPVTSSRFDIFDEDIPFMQAVFHGVIPYSSAAVNASPDHDEMLMMAAITGSIPKYDMICCDVSDLKDTDLDFLYYADSSYAVETALADYAVLEPLLSEIDGQYIVSYERNGDTICVGYSNGTNLRMKSGVWSVDNAEFGMRNA